MEKWEAIFGLKNLKTLPITNTLLHALDFRVRRVVLAVAFVAKEGMRADSWLGSLPGFFISWWCFTVLLHAEARGVFLKDKRLKCNSALKSD